MVRRDKENRELRKNFSNRSLTKDQCVLKSNKDIKDISIAEMEDIRKKVKSKNKVDEAIMVKSVIITLLCCMIIVAVIFYILSVIGWF